MDLKLKEGDTIMVHGWVMLKKLESGKWKVKKVEMRGTDAIYYFVRPRGKKVIAFYSRQIDGCIRDNGDLNRIEICTI